MTSPDLTSAYLIYNAESGGSRKSSPGALLAALAEAGYAATHLPTGSEQDLDALKALSGVFFVAGGDGTVRGVAKRLSGRKDTRLAIIPLGTSNNIAHTLGLDGAPEDLARRYAYTLERPYDVGRIQAPWGLDLFFEACGCGVFADVLAAYDPDEKKSPLRAAQALLTTLPGYQPLSLGLTLDGTAQPSRPLALLEVMNTRATGNSMNLATSADPSDGLLNVIQVSGEDRDSFVAYLTALARDDFEALPSVDAREARSVQIPYLGQAFHVDGEVRPAQPVATGTVDPVPSGTVLSGTVLSGTVPSGTVDLQVWPGALQLLVPAPG